MRVPKIAAALFSLGLLAACRSEEVENIQTKADNVARMLENRAGEIAAEAENGTDEQVEALENQTEMLANQAEAMREAGDNSAGSANKK